MDLQTTDTYEGFYYTFVGEVPELKELSETPQDPKWHAEGDVEEHTRMVLQNLRPRSFDMWDPLSVKLGAFFHDIGKVKRTKARMIDGKERVVSPGHAREGRSIVAKRLSHQIPWDTWWNTIQIVGMHHEPTKSDEKRHIYWLDRMLDVKDLYEVCMADKKGRICDDTSRLEDLKLFGMMVEEECDIHRGPNSHYAKNWDPELEERLEDSCSEEQMRFVKAESRFLAGRGDIRSWPEALWKSAVYRDEYPKLIMLCGVSASGKTTWVERHAPSAEIVSLDQIRAKIGNSTEDHSNEGKVRQESKRQLKRHLADNKTVIWDATNYRRDWRRNIIHIGYDYGAFVKMKVFMTPLEECMMRSDKPKVTNKQFESWQVPFSDECHVVEYLDKDYNAQIECLGGEKI